MNDVFPENDYRSYLQHSAKGSHWKSGHKYIAIKNGRYIYPEDLKGGAKNILSNTKIGKSYERHKKLEAARKDIGAMASEKHSFRKDSTDAYNYWSGSNRNRAKMNASNKESRKAKRAINRKYRNQKIKSVLGSVFKR